MCKDPIKGDYLRVDHLIEKVLETRLESGSMGPVKASPELDEADTAQYNDILAKIDSYDGDELGDLIKRLDIRNPNGNGEVLPPVPFNLMQVSSFPPRVLFEAYMYRIISNLFVRDFVCSSLTPHVEGSSQLSGLVQLHPFILGQRLPRGISSTSKSFWTATREPCLLPLRVLASHTEMRSLPGLAFFG